jgi:hypothetical protein
MPGRQIIRQGKYSVIRFILAALLAPALALAQQPSAPAPPPVLRHDGSSSVGSAPQGQPAGPEVPFVIKCYRPDTVPFVLSDKDGNILFEIRCPR